MEPPGIVADAFVGREEETPAHLPPLPPPPPTPPVDVGGPKSPRKSRKSEGAPATAGVSPLPTAIIPHIWHCLRLVFLCCLALASAIVGTVLMLLFLPNQGSHTDDALNKINNGMDGKALLYKGKKFYIHPTTVTSDDLIYDRKMTTTRSTTNSTAKNSTQTVLQSARDYVSASRLNEDVAELWLHRGFAEAVDGRTDDPLQADVFLVPAYFYLSGSTGKGMVDNLSHGERLGRLISQLDESIDSIVQQLILSTADGRGERNASLTLLTNETRTIMMEEWLAKNRLPHVVLSPATNAPMAGNLGIPKLVQFLARKVGRANVYAVSFERNDGWAGGTALSNVVVAPYVVRPHLSPKKMAEVFTNCTRRDNFVFYVANSRPHAVEWAGCNRSMVMPLKDEPNMKVGVGIGLTPQDFQHYMLESDYCLITCGDTPTSRRLTDSMIFGCIPIFIGTRLFGECEAPCFPGWGWTYTHGLPHLPYDERIHWRRFPIVDEASFAEEPKQALEDVFRNYSAADKEGLRMIMRRVQFSFIYGWGSPLDMPPHLGKATSALWTSIVDRLPEVNSSEAFISS